MVAAVLCHEGRSDISQEGTGLSPTCYVTINLHSPPVLRLFIRKSY